MFSTRWSPDDPLTVAAAGSSGSVQVWDVGSNGGARNVFAHKLQAAGHRLKEKEGRGLVTVHDEGEEGGESGWEDED